MSFKLPKLGLGTGSLSGYECQLTVERAVDVGYRHIDTAQIYENERAIGHALCSSSIDLKDVFIATKVHSRNLRYDDVITSAQRSRKKLGINTIDLLYVHWPAHTYNSEETMAAFAKLHDRGIVSHIGVSDFTRELLAEAEEASDLPVVANQIEMHPFCPQNDLHEYAIENDIWLVAHSPFAGGAVFDSEKLNHIADKYNATVAQITISWLLQKQNVVTIPQSSGRHLYENYESDFLSLDRTDVELIDSIKREIRVVDYDFSPWN